MAPTRGRGHPLSQKGVLDMKITRKLVAGSALTLALAGSATAWATSGASPAARGAQPAGRSLPSQYVAITPCRIVDTRVKGGPIAAGHIRSFQVDGVAGDATNEALFAKQGGHPCGVDSNAAAIEAVVTAPGALGNGYLRTWPYGTAEPTATVLNYSKLYPASTGSALAFTTGAANDLTVKTYGHSTQLVIDVVGFFQVPL
jgi:hypothetical protein